MGLIVSGCTSIYIHKAKVAYAKGDCPNTIKNLRMLTSNPVALYSLGQLYKKGECVEKNPEQAESYVEKAFDNIPMARSIKKKAIIPN
ncbi:SEL1-like repeat protein [Helicobacter cetorum]|uniref:SEL1-like repeat protein n=1 Tax=Helicobacter cetorum TaxID=138563 RepID=UPI001F413046|nr:SEL1-like repeat protein [Helicobacter cetorum]